MQKIISFLLKLGFSKTEIKIYIKLLSSGPMTVSELANLIKINRTACYPYIQNLLNKGSVSKLKSDNNKFKANPPEHISYLIDQKFGAIKLLQDTSPVIINSLNSTIINTKKINKNEISYYQGILGVKNIYKDILKSNYIRAYFSPEDLYNTLPENYKLFDNAMKNNKNMRMFEICEYTAKSKEIVENEIVKDRHLWKFLPSDIKLTSNDILIYDGKVAIINLRDKNTIDGVVLSNPDYYNNSVQLFDLLWRLLPES